MKWVDNQHEKLLRIFDLFQVTPGKTSDYETEWSNFDYVRHFFFIP